MQSQAWQMQKQRRNEEIMANLIEFFRMVLSYLLTFAVVVVVAGIGGVVGVKCWKPKVEIKEVKGE